MKYLGMVKAEHKGGQLFTNARDIEIKNADEFSIHKYSNLKENPVNYHSVIFSVFKSFSSPCLLLSYGSISRFVGALQRL